MKRKLINRSYLFKACENCSKRDDACHSGCEDYAKEVILGVMVEAKMQSEALKRENEFLICSRRAVRTAKKTGKGGKLALRSYYLRER